MSVGINVFVRNITERGTPYKEVSVCHEGENIKF
jgi:hypothetical protein